MEHYFSPSGGVNWAPNAIEIFSFATLHYLKFDTYVLIRPHEKEYSNLLKRNISILS